MKIGTFYWRGKGMNETLTDVLVEAGIRARDHRYVRSTPNNLGEALRNWAFMERIGAHSCFKVREELKKTEFADREWKLCFPSKPLPCETGFWFRHERTNLELGWFYHISTNETSLLFYIPELISQDVTGILKTCNSSKDYMWYFQEKRDYGESC